MSYSFNFIFPSFKAFSHHASAPLLANATGGATHPFAAPLLTLVGSLVVAALTFYAFKRNLKFNEKKHTEDTLNASTKHAADLDAAAKRHREDSELSIRKELFFGLLSATSDATFLISNFFVKSSAINHSLIMMNLATAATKFQASATKAALEAAFSFQEKLNEALSELMPLRAQWNALSKHLEHTASKKSDYESDAQRASHHDIPQMPSNIEDIESAIDELLKSIVQKTEECLKRIQDPQTELILFARNELGLDIDQKWFRKRRTQMLLQDFRKFKESPKRLRSHMEYLN